MVPWMPEGWEEAETGPWEAEEDMESWEAEAEVQETFAP